MLTDDKNLHTYHRNGCLGMTKFRLVLFAIFISLLVFFLSGCFFTEQEPKAFFTASSTSGTAPLKVDFDASSSYDPDSSLIKYSWEFGDGSTGKGKTTTHSYNSSGNYLVELVVTDSDGETKSTTNTIEVYPSPPSAKFTAQPTSGEVPLKVSFDASESHDPDGTIVSYSWEFGDNSLASGEVVTNTFESAGEYVVELIVTDNDGRTASVTETINVTPFYNRSPTASFTAYPTIGKVPFKVSFDASESFDTDGSVEKYTWDFGDGSTESGETVSHAFSEVGTYTVELTVTDNHGAVDTETTSISATDKPVVILDKELVEGGSGQAVVEGKLKNVSDKKIEASKVIARFYCPLGAELGMESSTLNGIELGATVTFRISSSLNYSDVDRVELDTEVNY